jgi:hypothetical protein
LRIDLRTVDNLILLDYDTSNNIFIFWRLLHNNWDNLFILKIMRYIWSLWMIIWNLSINIYNLICILNVVILCDIINNRLDYYELLIFMWLVDFLYLLLRSLWINYLLGLLLYYRYDRLSEFYKMLVYIVNI